MLWGGCKYYVYKYIFSKVINVLWGLTGENIHSVRVPQGHGLFQSQEVDVVSRIDCLCNTEYAVSHRDSPP